MGRMISTKSFLYNIYNMPTSGIITGFVFYKMERKTHGSLRQWDVSDKCSD